MRWFHVEATGTPTTGYLLMEWDNIANVPVASATSVANWNTFFGISTITNVVVSGNVVEIYAGTGHSLAGNRFNGNTHLVRWEDTDVFTTYGNQPFIDTTSLVSASSLGVTSVGSSCFACSASNTSLVSINFPELVTAGNGTFLRRSGITSASFPKLAVIPNSFMRYCGALVIFEAELATDIGFAAFSECFVLTEAIVPMAVEIRQSAFLNAPKLQRAIYPNCTTIHGTAFNLSTQDPSLVDIYFPELTTFVGGANFTNRNGITVVDLPKVTSVPNAFNGADGITTINLPLATSLGTSAFQASVALAPSTTSVYAPLVTSVGNSCFFRRTGLTYIDLSSCTALGATTANNNVFFGISGNTITFLLPVGTRTDGDAVAIAAANTVTFLP